MHGVEQGECMYLSARSDLDAVLLLPPASCVSFGDTPLAQLGLGVFIHKMGIVSSLLQGAQSCGEGSEGSEDQATVGLGLDC